MSTDQANKPEATDPAIQKARLECDKLRAEIDLIRKPLWSTPGFTPVILGVLGLIFTWATGWFDVQRTRISNDKTLLEAQTERLLTQRQRLEEQTKEQQARVARAEEEIGILRQRESQLTNQLASLSRDRDELRVAKEVLEAETKRLAGNDANVNRILEQLKALQSSRENLSAELQASQATNAAFETASQRQLALIRWADNIISQGMGVVIQDKSTWSKAKHFTDQVWQWRFASTEYLPSWWHVDPDPKARPVNYDDALEEHVINLAERMKPLDQKLQEARERLQLLDAARTNQPKLKGP